MEISGRSVHSLPSITNQHGPDLQSSGQVGVDWGILRSGNVPGGLR